MLTVDLAVVGAGLVGASVTAAVANHPMARGLSVALIDPNLPDPNKIPPVSLRTSTLNPSSVDFLDGIGAWDLMPSHRAVPFDDMVIWDNPNAPHQLGAQGERGEQDESSGNIRFRADMVSRDVLGHVVDNAALRFALLKRVSDLKQEGKVELNIIQAGLSDVVYPEDNLEWPTINLDNDSEITARLVVACDGARSRVRTSAGMQWFAKPYGEHAVVATIALKEPIRTAYQRFLTTGPVAVLPMASAPDEEPLANVVWTTTPTEAAALKAADDNTFTHELVAALGDADDAPPGRADKAWSKIAPASFEAPTLPGILGVRGNRGGFPLHLGHAPDYVDQRARTVLVGDAAHAVHPLAGQGVNLGFADANALTNVVTQDAGTGNDLGGPHSGILNYQAQRLPANIAMLSLLHGVHAVFAAKSTPARDIRRIGMSCLNYLPSVKRSILALMR